MSAKSLLYGASQLEQPPGCGSGRTEVTTTLREGDRLYTVVVRDKVIVEDPYLVLVKAAAFSIAKSEPYMGRAVPRSVRDVLLKSSVVV